jgi:ATPase family associated with various cellular activities (AAA)
MNDDELLNQTLAQQNASFSGAPMLRLGAAQGAFQLQQQMPLNQSAVQPSEYRQWQVGPNDTFRAAGVTVTSLPPGVYVGGFDHYGPYVERRPVLCDDLIDLPDHATSRVLAGMETFWKSADRYRALGFIHKRGVLLWGPQGSGKTVTVQLLMSRLIARNGIVLLFGVPQITLSVLPMVRRIEPARPLIVVMEDIDEMIGSYGEHDILSFLDGEKQIDNVVQIATTNHPERLGARILNRPSRFDERIFVGMPSAESRLTYLQNTVQRSGTPVESAELLRWRDDTDGLSIAHLRELIAGLLCLNEPYESVLSRLRAMAERPNPVEGFPHLMMGVAEQ